MTILEMDSRLYTVGVLVQEAFDHDDGTRFNNTPEWKEATGLVEELNVHFEAIGANLRCVWSTSYSKYILLQEE